MSLPEVGHIEEGTVVRVYPRYAILLFKGGWTGLLHISELSSKYIRNFSSFVSVGNIYTVKVIAVDEKRRNVRVSLKKMTGEDRRKAYGHKRIEKDEIDFSALEEHLPIWIEEANRAKGE